MATTSPDGVAIIDTTQARPGETSTITVTLLDAGSNPVSGKTVTLSQGAGSSTISPPSATSNASGVATFTVKDTKAEVVTYTATDTTDTITITATATVTFTAGAVNAGKSTVSANPTSVQSWFFPPLV